VLQKEGSTARWKVLEMWRDRSLPMGMSRKGRGTAEGGEDNRRRR